MHQPPSFAIGAPQRLDVFVEVAQGGLIEAEAGELDDVAARGELAAGFAARAADCAADDHRTRRLGFGQRLQFIEDASKLAPHRDVERIALARVGQHDAGKGAIDVKLNDSAHVLILSPCKAAHRSRCCPRHQAEKRFLFPGTKALNVAATILVFLVLVASFDLLLGYTGIVSSAHTMFFGIWAYGIAIARTRLGSTWLAVAAGVVAALAVSLLLSLLIGLFSLRVKAVFFAMITLAVASAFLPLASQLSEFTGGESYLQVLMKLRRRSFSRSSKACRCCRGCCR